MKKMRKLKMKDLEEIRKKKVHSSKEYYKIDQIMIENIINNNSL